MKLKSFALTIFAFSLALVAGNKAAEAVSLTVVADNLNNPRNLTFGPDGNIYLTESGSGGDGKDGRCIPSPSAQFIPLCAGNTGSVLKITPDGNKVPIIPNLPSLALTPSGEQAAGPADFKFDSKGNAYLLMGYAGNPGLRETVLKTPILGQLLKVDLNTGSLSSIADLADYELKFNPDGTDIVTNPYALDIKDDLAYVVDGGANTIYTVGLDGTGVKNVAAFPERIIDQSELEFPSIPPVGEIPPTEGGGEGGQAFPITFQSVPTAIANAPNGGLTVAEYTYFPYPEGKARIFSVDPKTLGIETIADGFTQLTGVTYDPEGNLYALQHINNSEWKEIQQGGIVTGDISGSLIKIARDGTRSTIWNGKGLEAASGLLLGPDGAFYTSNRARLAGTGQLIKIDPKATVPEPASVLGLLTIGALGMASKFKSKRKELANC